MKQITHNAFRLACCLLNTSVEEILSKNTKREVCKKRYAIRYYLKIELGLYSDELMSLFKCSKNLLYKRIKLLDINGNYYKNFAKEMNHYIKP